MVIVPYGNKSDKSQGRGDRVPALAFILFDLIRRINAGDWVDTRQIILVVLIRRQSCELPNITILVVVISPISNGLFNLAECSGILNFVTDFILHMTKERFLRSVIPAVGST